MSLSNWGKQLSFEESTVSENKSLAENRSTETKCLKPSLCPRSSCASIGGEQAQKKEEWEKFHKDKKGIEELSENCAAKTSRSQIQLRYWCFGDS